MSEPALRLEDGTKCAAAQFLQVAVRLPWDIMAVLGPLMVEDGISPVYLGQCHFQVKHCRLRLRNDTDMG